MMETVTMTLSDFLLARIAEDEEEAERDRERFVSQHGLAELAEWRGWGSAYRNPSRVLAECAAKRRIVGLCERARELWETASPSIALREAGIEQGDLVLAYLALPYADHSDYRPEWKP